MYEFIRGKLISKDPGAAVVEAGGVGYRMHITATCFDQLPGKGEEVKLHAHHIINAEQGVERLYGFLEDRERLLFRQLLDVQRVGPAVALRILSNAGADTLIGAIAGGDVATLRRIKGVGAKMAERLVIELQEPLSKLGFMKGLADDDTGVAAPSAVNRDAVGALVALGYKPAMAEKAVTAACKKLAPGAVASEIIRTALQLV